MNEWNEPSWQTDLAQMPTQDQHKSTKTMSLEMSWHCQGQPILSFLPICDPVMPQATVVDSSHYRQNRRTQQDEEEYSPFDKSSCPASLLGMIG